MKKASYIFGILKERLHSPDFVKLCRITPSDFTRNRFLSCQILVLFILNILRKSIPKELISFCEYCNIKEVSRSAITQARSKLAPQAFIYLNDILVDEFYTDNTFKTHQGFIVTAIDGSMLELPIDSPDILKHFGFASNQTNKQFPMARVSHIYDVINGITIDAIIAPYSIGERNMAIQHLEKLRLSWPKERFERLFVIFDRGYPSAPLMIYLMKHGINFLMRCNTKFMKEVDDSVAKSKKDGIIKFSGNRNGAAKIEMQKLFPNLDKSESFLLRVMIVILATGEKEVLLTSLLDQKKYPYKIFREFYFMRWGAEENYKFIKVQLEIENFSGKTSLAVMQDFHAGILAANARALLALETINEIALQTNFSGIAEKKYCYIINKKISMERFKNEFVAVILDPVADIENFCIKAKKTMMRNLVPKRPKRSFKRLRKHPHRRFHMNLR